MQTQPDFIISYAINFIIWQTWFTTMFFDWSIMTDSQPCFWLINHDGFTTMFFDWSIMTDSQSCFLIDQSWRIHNHVFWLINHDGFVLLYPKKNTLCNCKFVLCLQIIFYFFGGSQKINNYIQILKTRRSM